MSRIGKKAISVPKGVTVTLKDQHVEVKGPKATLNLDVPALIKVTLENDHIICERTDETRKSNAFHGLIRSLIQNMIIGVTEGYKKDLVIIGVGYRAAIAGSKLTLNIGYSHPVEYTVPQGVTVTVAENTKITVTGADKQAVGEVAATIRRFRKPEPYKGKGIRYVDEQVRQKEGKTVG